MCGLEAIEMERILSFCVSKEYIGKDIFRYLKGKDLSASFIRQLKKEGRIQVNNVISPVGQVLEEGDCLEIILPREQSEQLIPEKMEINILHEDEDVLVVNKRAGIAVHPTLNYPSGTLANGIMFYWHSKSKHYRFRALNRLDKDTSGIVMIPLNLFSYNRIVHQLENNKIKKTYIAMVHGSFPHEIGEINLPIGRKDNSIIEREVREDGQTAITQYRRLLKTNDLSVLELTLITGRTHQIRVHLSHLGYPIIGDTLYGGLRDRIQRQALHAHGVTFTHPFTGESMNITAPIPPDMYPLLHTVIPE